MLKKTITYTDYNGMERTEDFYFNLSKAEVAEMELAKKGGLSEYYKRILAAKDTPAIAAVFKELVLKAYGVKSEDGRRFIKSPEITADFEQTEAYSDLYMELATDDKKATEFFNAIVPKVENKASDK